MWVGFWVLSSSYRAVAVKLCSLTTRTVVPLELCCCVQCRVLSLSFTEELAFKASEKVLIFLASVQQVLCVHITVLIIEDI